MYIPIAISDAIKPIIPAININQPKIKIKLKLNSIRLFKQFPHRKFHFLLIQLNGPMME
ncbi:hypothetical protein GCM10008983_03700 [Lentibacillus halophilus]|uniref:Uncharacterized protein n=1 Tax=Lentibacillus halophilus TaxID=295065 RepID=A0ABN0Z397_9BACI